MYERKFEYTTANVTAVPQATASGVVVAAGATLFVAIPIVGGVPFELRQLFFYSQSDDLVDCRITIFKANGDRFATQRLPMTCYGDPTANFSGKMFPVVPGEIYPETGQIAFEVQNTGALSVQFWPVFSGVTHEPGDPPCRYPDRYRERAFAFSRVLALNGTAFTILRDNPIPAIDGDYVIRDLQVSPQRTADQGALGRFFLKLSDAERRAYSNDFIPYLELFNRDTPEFGAPVVPEIWIPNGSVLFWEIFRNDVGGITNTNFVFRGARVVAA
ncbi:hypothetical protein EPO44_10190 [bacterium]|nr:MAG: hypothetical protein EPO44_10190 [bacterium]